jgi:hypothetical protein
MPPSSSGSNSMPNQGEAVNKEIYVEPAGYTIGK